MPTQSEVDQLMEVQDNKVMSLVVWFSEYVEKLEIVLLKMDGASREQIAEALWGLWDFKYPEIMWYKDKGCKIHYGSPRWALFRIFRYYLERKWRRH